MSSQVLPHEQRQRRNRDGYNDVELEGLSLAVAIEPKKKREN